LSTHIVDDVKELCSDMAIINKGQVLYKGNPNHAISTLDGKIWQKRVEKSELPDYKSNFKVISEKLIGGSPVIHILSDEGNPDGTFESVSGDLEDVYFSTISVA